MSKFQLTIYIKRKGALSEIIYTNPISETIAKIPFYKHPDDIAKGSKITLEHSSLSLAQFARLPKDMLIAIRNELSLKGKAKLWNSVKDEPLNKANYSTLVQYFCPDEPKKVELPTKPKKKESYVKTLEPEIVIKTKPKTKPKKPKFDFDF